MNTKDIPNPITVLQSIHPFNCLDIDILEKLATELEYKTYPKGTYVFNFCHPEHSEGSLNP